MVGGTSVFIEFPEVVCFENGIKTASALLKHSVTSLRIPYVDVANEIRRKNIVRILHGYTDDELCVSHSQKRRKQNKTDLAILTTSSARELVTTGVIPPSKYSQTLKTQIDLGLLIKNDGIRRRADPGESFLLTFIVGGIQQHHEIVIPFNRSQSDDIHLDKHNLARCTHKNTSGKRCVRIVDLPTVRHRIECSKKKAHYWFWSFEPSTGKTTNMDGVSDVAFTMITRYENGFFDTVDPQAQIVFIDEYCNGGTSRRIPISELNLMCDGGYRFNVKNKKPVRLIDRNPLIVIFSNKPPEEIYTKWNGKRHVVNELENALLHVRFNVVEIKNKK